MLTLRLFFTLGYLFDGEKNFSLFFFNRSRLCVVSSRRVLKCFLTSKQVLFEVSEKKLEMNAFWKKKKSKCIWHLWKKKFFLNSWNPFLISIWHTRTPPFTFKRKITIIFDDSIWPIHFGQIKSFKNKDAVSS